VLRYYVYAMAATTLDGQSQQHVYSRDYAESLDMQDPLRHMSREFLIPSKAELKAKTFEQVGMRMPSSVQTSKVC
jgi:kynureninase